MINDFKEFIGKQYTTNEGYLVEIIDYLGRKQVLIKFIDNPDCQIWSTIQNLEKGQLKFPYHKSVYNIGYYGEGKYTARVNNIKTPQYIKWFSMFCRCYDEKYQEKEPSYIGCCVDESFHNFQNFAKWYDEKIYECKYPLELDKDLLYEGNKVYSPSTCCFLPKEINNALKYKRKDYQYMKQLYDKYKNDLPYLLRLELYKFTIRR